MQEAESSVQEGRGPVLLVEDDPDDARLITRAFRKVAAATALERVDDGEKAIAYLAGQSPFGPDRAMPTVVILDLKLPRKSGFEVLEWAKSQPAIRRLPIVILSSSKEPIDVARAYDLGASSYLVKPVRSTALTALIESVNAYWVSINEPPPLPSL
jgi:CheY-like chemotaxis protein